MLPKTNFRFNDLWSSFVFDDMGRFKRGSIGPLNLTFLSPSGNQMLAGMRMLFKAVVGYGRRFEVGLFS